MFKDELEMFAPETEMEIVYNYNNSRKKPTPIYYLDPINTYDLNGNLIGYTWNYGDAIELAIHLNNTVLHSDKEHIDLFEKYLSDKEVEINFIDMRGEVKYTFYVPASLHTKLKLNYSDETLIERNEYKCTLVLINPYDLSRINLLEKPYSVYVK